LIFPRQKIKTHGGQKPPLPAPFSPNLKKKPTKNEVHGFGFWKGFLEFLLAEGRWGEALGSDGGGRGPVSHPGRKGKKNLKRLTVYQFCKKKGNQSF